MRRILVAFLVLGTLGAVFLYVQRRETREAREERARSRLLDFDQRAVTGFELESGGRGWRFSRSGGAWRLTSPVADAADGRAVEALLVAARTAKVSRTIQEPEAMSAYGLDPPRVSLTIRGVEAPRLDVGDVAPTGEGFFARIDGREGVLVVDRVEGGALERADPLLLRDPTLTGAVLSEVQGLEIRAEGRRFRLEREAEGWWVREPVRMPASDSKVSRFLGALEKVGVERYADDAARDDPALGLGAGALTIVLRCDSSSRTVHLGSAASGDSRWAARDDRERPFLVSFAALPSEPVGIRDLADTRLTKTNRYEVTRFRYLAGARSLDLVREGKDSWRTAAGVEVPKEPVLRFLVAVLEAPVASVDAGGPLPGAPEATMEYEAESAKRERIDFHAGREARVASLPGVRFLLEGPPPEVPALP